MAVASEASGNVPPRAADRAPVGVRILRLFGYPLQRAGVIPDRYSDFLTPLCSAAILLSVIYGIGILVAWHDGVESQFLASPLVPSLLIVTGWGAVWISWAGAVYRNWEAGDQVGRASSTMFPMVHLAEGLRDRLDAHWARLCSLRAAAAYVVPGIALILIYAGCAIYLPFASPIQAPLAVRALFRFPDGSYLLFAYLAAVAAILADVGAYGLFFTVEHLRFVSEFVAAERSMLGTSKSATVKQLYLAQRPLQELAYASFLSTMAWFGAISVLVLVFVLALNIVTFVGLLALMVFALYVFLEPQWEFHQLIRSAKQSALDRLEGSMGADWYDAETNAPKREHVPTLVLAQNVAALSDWHMDVRLVIAQIVGALFPLVAAVFGGPLGIHLGG